jgi:hypothetical protein
MEINGTKPKCSTQPLSNDEERVMRVIQAAVISAIVVLISINPVQAQVDVKPEEPDGPAKTYLEALKTSDFVQAGEAATPSHVRWSTQHLPVVFDYKILRGSVSCSDQFRYDDVREDVLHYVQAFQRFNAITDPANINESPPDLEKIRKLTQELNHAREQIVSHSKCFGAILNMPDAIDLVPNWTTPSGTATVSLYTFIIDVDEPGKGGARVTTRRRLSLARMTAPGLSSGWRVIGFVP